MTNYDKYKDEIVRTICKANISDIAYDKTTNTVCLCRNLPCDDCFFNNNDQSNCYEDKLAWLDRQESDDPIVVSAEEYWSSVKLYTPIYVYDHDGDPKHVEFFCGYDGHYIITVPMYPVSHNAMRHYWVFAERINKEDI